MVPCYSTETAAGLRTVIAAHMTSTSPQRATYQRTKRRTMSSSDAPPPLSQVDCGRNARRLLASTRLEGGSVTAETQADTVLYVPGELTRENCGDA